MIPEMPDRIIDVRDVFHNINMLLKYYRHFKLYCEHAVDAIDWHLHDHHFQTVIDAIGEHQLESMTILTHIDTMMERYHDLCSLHGDDRRYNLIRLKYLDMDCAEFGRCVPTAEQLADWFDCDVRTVQRDIRLAKRELSILIFGDAKKILKKSK